MINSLRTSLCLVRRPQRVALTRSPALRASLSTSATTRRRRTWIPVAAGALTVSVALALGTVVRLDAAGDEKRKPSSNAKQIQSSQVEESVPDGHKATEILQTHEEEASAEADLDSGEDGESADHGGGGAFNPETGEINWDCPCLGRMAHGPCGQEFRDAFSCFVYSEEEPKGINCVDKFKNMQDCFRRHPEVYGEEIMSDDDDDDASPSGTDSSGMEGEVVPDPEPLTTQTVSPTSNS